MAAATLTKAMLEDLHKGMAAISLVTYPSGGVDFDTLDFKSADQIFTIKDSFNLTPSESSTEEIKIDQRDEAIDTTVTKGEWTMAGNIPSVATALLAYFFNQGQTVASLIGQEGDTYAGAGYFSEAKEVICSVLIESASKKTAIAFARVKFVVNGISIEGTDTPSYLAFTGSVLANTMSGKGDFAVLKNTAV
jgi:hypothetical protein